MEHVWPSFLQLHFRKIENLKPWQARGWDCQAPRCRGNTHCPALGGPFHSRPQGAHATWPPCPPHCVARAAFLCARRELHARLPARLAQQSLHGSLPAAPRLPGHREAPAGRRKGWLCGPCDRVDREYSHCIVTVFLHFPDVLDSTYCILIVHIALFMYLR